MPFAICQLLATALFWPESVEGLSWRSARLQACFLNVRILSFWSFAPPVDGVVHGHAKRVLSGTEMDFHSLSRELSEFQSLKVDAIQAD